MNIADLNLVILAAGQGVRLGELAENKPKSLVCIRNNKSYLEYQLDAFAQFTFANRIVVGGYGFSCLKDFFSAENFLDYQLLNNTEYHKGNLYSLLTAKSHLKTGFYLFNADHYYSLVTYRKIFDKVREHVTVFCDHDRQLVADDMKVKTDALGGFSVMSKTLSDFSLGYVGVTHIPTAFLPDYWRACEQTKQLLGEKANVESVINQLVQNGVSVHIEDISGSWWTEIDTPEDYQKACKVILNHL